MDVEPIYCAEQIVVPVDLADVLKAFTKEVIRRQPADIIDFGAKYFENLANVSSASKDAPVPTQDQLKVVLSRADGAKALAQEQVEALCSQAGISSSICAKVLHVGRFGERSGVDVERFLFLLLAMTCDSFAAVTTGIFELFGSELQSERFVQFISYLAPDMDPDVTTQFLADLKSALMDVEWVTYDKVASLGVLGDKLHT
uniref:RIIa domain-containing protein n=1 Tax=Chlamydomonas euryale TaxID=1486919 RepID=A0A7R9VYB6_9CHLO|mmetsp:Transcript_6247/g.19308  ORF Transcript_6247/g.19308 Transcript_6247/m.19308 type:complete len:201 (+) Transcript_6247:142-744(+)